MPRITNFWALRVMGGWIMVGVVVVVVVVVMGLSNLCTLKGLPKLPV
jgi:hypothetical protein